MFFEELLAGEVTPARYISYLHRLLPVYQALDAACREAPLSHPATALFDPRLARAPALLADLAFWGRQPHLAPDSSAASTYVKRITEVSADPVRLLAHHYTRYLGDLSGGQIVRTVLRRHDDQLRDLGTAFYEFCEIESVKRYRDAYRCRLDNLNLTSAEISDLVTEAVTAFRLSLRLVSGL